MSEQQVMLTEEGYEKLENELEYLETEKRREVAKRIKVAREFGDISENSEYDDAKNEQAFVEGRIQEIKNMINNAHVVKDEDVTDKKVNLGTTVMLHDLDSDEKISYTLVGSAEADPLNYKISNESPIGKAILGHGIGDEVTVETPAGEVNYKIISIKKVKH
ncbi:transcription elongation factor GreA [Halanaerobium congolense]|jgi:transcription elongation factor GreA|uniref:Transcription elongation factor GreA n=1 Tax=Halanaerobium congolense TaxID=54121 RepID=A0A1G6SG78_9FIRM|nr:transcription elongation factor GreA [Halanaerobium congolense]KXS49513.1 MAG: Transcription elongation factor GreA [Halanaerobium sp. T82-1]PUU89650.1 MAG: Transcription elongation factor GreA [Halanaerobium sp.]PTX15606.1 transcription elongation factor GreA [Halanaerobium congolense]PXV62715.1 transcription elongation factor GreA [Halanaerobium congolense]TDP13553.1 transcription elongation factor GreA [Halanaerobium congolense]